MLLFIGFCLLRNFVLEFPKGIDTKIYKNSLDHFNQLDDTKFDQRYYENLSFVPEDGFNVAILYFGGESPLGSSSVLSGSHIELAKRLNAALFGLEHRFFGESQPFNDLSTEHLKYLTIDQAMADLASFISEIIYNHPSRNKNSKIRIGAVGGSYPGALSSWFRLKYPQFAYASWASSAPVLIKNDFREYDEHIAKQLELYSSKCLDHTQQVLDIVKQYAIDQPQKLRKDFGFDETERPDDMIYAVTDVVAAMVQYNSKVHLMETHCKLQEQEPNYNNLVTIVNNISIVMGSTPKDADLMLQTNESLESPYANGRAWSYMTCNEVGWFQTAGGRLRPKSLDINYFADVCDKLFGLKLPDELEKNNYFGGNDPQQTKVYFLNGDVDPWSTMSVEEPNEGLLRRTIVIANESHCADLYDIRPTDSEVLRKAKESVIDQMYFWLTESNCNGTCVHGRCTINGCICDDKYGGEKCDTEIKSKKSFDIVVICAVSIPVFIFVVVIFTVWLVTKNRQNVVSRPLLTNN